MGCYGRGKNDHFRGDAGMAADSVSPTGKCPWSFGCITRNYEGFLKRCGRVRDHGHRLRGRHRASSPMAATGVKIAVLKEADAETRVAAIPETARNSPPSAPASRSSGARAKGPHRGCRLRAAGATIGDRAAMLADADIVLCVTGPEANPRGGEARRAAGRGARPRSPREEIAAYAEAGLEALAMDGCRASRAPSRWTSCRRSRTSPATRRWSTRPRPMAAPFR